MNIDWNARYTSGGKDVVKLLLKYSEVVGIDKASVGAMPGQEAPILIELRKRKIEADMEGGETSNRYTNGVTPSYLNVRRTTWGRV